MGRRNVIRGTSGERFGIHAGLSLGLARHLGSEVGLSFTGALVGRPASPVS